MAKKPKPSAVVQMASLSSKTKRPRANRPGPGRQVADEPERIKTKGGILTIHHPPEASPRSGADERRATLKWRAMQLTTRGYSLRQVGERLKTDFDLTKAPSHVDINEWLDEAFADTVTAKQLDSGRQCDLVFIRGEELIKNLTPIALGEVLIRRTRIVDGAEMEVIDERAVDEMLRCTAEIRKLMDQRGRFFKLGRVGLEGGADSGMTGHNLTLLVEKTVTNHIHLPGQEPRAAVTLVLESGDRDVDQLDAEAIFSLTPGILAETTPGPL